MKLNLYFIGVFFLLAIFFMLPNFASAAVENLDEMFSRKARLSGVTWGPALLENSTNNYTWQPETLNYLDVTTGNEVWRLTYTPAQMGGVNHDIASTHWSANGNRLLVQSKRSTNAFPYATGGLMWMMTNADGSRLKPAKGAAAQLPTVDGYVLWSPVLADVYYSGYANDGQATATNTLYKMTVSDTNISRMAFLTIPSSNPRISIKKAISGDGATIIVGDSNNGLFFPMTVYPEASKSLNSTDGYSNILNFDYYWGLTPTPWASYHDRYLAGAKNGIDGVWNYLMPENASGSLWRARPTGTGVNNAPTHITDHTSPYDWGGEIEPVNTRASLVQGENDPWCPQGTVPNTDCATYFGHVSPDRWGHYLISEQTTRSPEGVAFWDARTHKYKSIITAMQDGNHTDWEAWSDWSISDGARLFSDTWNGLAGSKRVYTQNYLDTNSTKELAYCHSNYNTGATSEASYLGPIQSPDGTKAQFVSSFMNSSDDHSQLFWTTAYYPYPPEIESAAKNGSNVRMTWDFNQGSGCASQSTSVTRTGPTPNFSTPRTYATRGWPHETLDCAPSPREIKEFRVWSSDDNLTWTPIGTTTYNNCSGNNECGMWTESSWNHDATQANNSTKYYAVTSVEHSGLESKTLSNVWRVVTDGSGNITEQTEQTAYPTDPGGKSNFFTTSPDAPTLISANHKESPATADGQYTISWSAPTNHDLIRYYNIYASDLGVPSAIQQSRIASIPATSDYDDDGNFSYVDWLGNPTDVLNQQTQYKITAVDFQGNESGVVDLIAPAAPSGLSVL